MQRRVNLLDLVKSFQTSIYLQKSASIQPRTSRSKFADPSTGHQHRSVDLVLELLAPELERQAAEVHAREQVLHPPLHGLRALRGGEVAVEEAPGVRDSADRPQRAFGGLRASHSDQADFTSLRFFFRAYRTKDLNR